MRLAELLMAIAMAVLSGYLMWKSAELPIGWIAGEGPGGGAFPFWLAAGMLVCCLAIIVRWVRRTSPPARSELPYMDRLTLKLFLLIGGSLTVLLAAIHFIGVYFALPLFLIFYLQVLGRHRWLTTGALAAATPVVIFLFFEIALKITLPKGYTEPLFYPLYAVFF